MRVYFDINELPDGRLRVTEKSYERGAYATDTESQSTSDAPMFSDSASITLVVRTGAESAFSKAFIHDHSVTDIVNEFILPGDGRYQVTQIIVPTREWLDAATKGGFLPQKGHVVITDGTALYEVTGDTQEEIDIDSLSGMLDDSTVWYLVKDMYRLFGLRRCYWAMCSSMLDAGCDKMTACPDCDANGMYELNLILVLLKTAAFLASKGRWDEADGMLDAAGGKCSSLCGRYVGRDCACEGWTPPQAQMGSAEFEIDAEAEEVKTGCDFYVGVTLQD